MNIKPMAPRRTVSVTLASLGLLFVTPSLPAKEPSEALELARQLNQAFIEVADKVSSAVVVVRIAHKSNFFAAGDDEDDSLSPFFERLPPEFRRWFEERRDRQRRDEQKERESHGEPIFDGQGSGVVI